MLMISYIIVSALEITMTVQAYDKGLHTVGWAYGFLMITSLLSVGVELSHAGQKVRKELKNLGIDSAKYDLLANGAKSAFYLMVTLNILDLSIAVFWAYLVTFSCLVLAIKKVKA